MEELTLSQNDKDFTEVDVPLESREDMHLRRGGLPGWPGVKLGRRGQQPRKGP